MELSAIVNLMPKFVPLEEWEDTCPKHGAYTKDRYEQYVSGCPCCLQERKEAETAAILREMAQHNREMAAKLAREKLAQSIDIPPRFVGKTVADWQPENEQEAMLRKSVVKYGQMLQSHHAGALVLHGNKGTGKTHLACALLAMVKGQMGGNVQYATVGDLFRRVRESKNFKSLVNESEILAEYAKFDLLALDEIGNQKGGDDEMRVLFDVLNKRYEKGRPTALISNLSRDALVEFLGEIVWDRLQEGGLILTFAGRSRRTGFNHAA